MEKNLSQFLEQHNVHFVEDDGSFSFDCSSREDSDVLKALCSTEGHIELPVGEDVVSQDDSYTVERLSLCL